MPLAHAADADDAIDGRGDAGAVQLDLRQRQRGLAAAKLGAGLLDPGVQHVQLFARRRDGCLLRDDRGLDAFHVGDRRLKLLAAGPAALFQRGLALVLAVDAFAVGLQRGKAGLGLFDDAMLQRDLAFDIVDRGAGGGGARTGLIDMGPIFGRIDLHQQVAGADRLIIGDQQAGDAACDLGADRGGVGAQRGIVGGLVGQAGDPAAPAQRHDHGKADPGHDDRGPRQCQKGPLAGLFARQLRGGGIGFRFELNDRLAHRICSLNGCLEKGRHGGPSLG